MKFTCSWYTCRLSQERGILIARFLPWYSGMLGVDFALQYETLGSTRSPSISVSIKIMVLGYPRTLFDARLLDWETADEQVRKYRDPKVQARFITAELFLTQVLISDKDSSLITYQSFASIRKKLRRTNGHVHVIGAASRHPNASALRAPMQKYENMPRRDAMHDVLLKFMGLGSCLLLGLLIAFLFESFSQGCRWEVQQRACAK